MDRIFQRFVELLSNAADVDAFAHTMAETAAALDLSCFAYLALPQKFDRKPLVVSTYPADWVTHYLHHNYERIDPIIARALQVREPFQWGRDLTPRSLSPRQQHFLCEASEFGIRQGFTVPIHDRSGSTAALTFAANQRLPKFEKCIETNERVLQLMAMSFHTHIRRKLSHTLSVGGAHLSHREFECLQWASQGKSAWEIGQILGISRYTASYYLNNVKQKLGVRTIVQAAMCLADAKRNEED